jgi:hypothetical protein
MFEYRRHETFPNISEVSQHRLNRHPSS